MKRTHQQAQRHVFINEGDDSCALQSHISWIYYVIHFAWVIEKAKVPALFVLCRSMFEVHIFPSRQACPLGGYPTQAVPNTFVSYRHGTFDLADPGKLSIGSGHAARRALAVEPTDRSAVSPRTPEC